MLDQQGIATTLLSGFAGALIVQLLTMGWEEWKRRREKCALLEGIIAECDYNLSIVGEILEGVVERNGSFKRMSVEFFRTARESSVKYSLTRELIWTLSRAIIDLELYNLEADYVFSGAESKTVYAGAIDEKPILVEQHPNGRDVLPIIKNAHRGVTNTLNDLKKIVNKSLNGEEE